MKKFLIAFAVAAIAVAGSFAQDAVSDAMAAAESAREEVPQSLQGRCAARSHFYFPGTDVPAHCS